MFNTSRNFVSRSGVEAMQVCPRKKLKSACHLSSIASHLSSLKSCLTPWLKSSSTNKVFVEVYEKQNSNFVLTQIRVYVFGLSFLSTLDI